MARRKEDDGLVRLNKLLANRGIESRRHVEGMIIEGRIKVDGELATEKGMKVRPDARLEVDGKLITGRPAPVWLALHKPRGYVCTREDDRDRPIVMDLFPEELRHVHSIGRLDGDVSGLLLFTNQGELTHRLTHPRYEVDKVYVVHTGGPFTDEQRQRIEQGVQLDDGPAAPARCWVLSRRESTGTVVELTIHEGRKHQVKRMFIAAGNRVRRLERVKVGPVELGNLERANWRHLTPEEVKALYESAGIPMPSGGEAPRVQPRPAAAPTPARSMPEPREARPARPTRPARSDEPRSRPSRPSSREARPRSDSAVESDWRKPKRWESHGAGGRVPSRPTDSRSQGSSGGRDRPAPSRRDEREKPERPLWMDQGRKPRPGDERQAPPERGGRDDRSRTSGGSRSFGSSRTTGSDRPARPPRDDRPREDRPRRTEGGSRSFGSSRTTGSDRPARPPRDDRPREDRPRRTEGGSRSFGSSRTTGSDRPARPPRDDRPREDRPRRTEGGSRSFGSSRTAGSDRPARPPRDDRPRDSRTGRSAEARHFGTRSEGDGSARPPREERPREDRPRRSEAGRRPGPPRSGSDRPARPPRPGGSSGGPSTGRPRADRPSGPRPPKPAAGGKSSAPPRSARAKQSTPRPMRDPRGPRNKGPNRGKKR